MLARSSAQVPIWLSGICLMTGYATWVTFLDFLGLRRDQVHGHSRKTFLPLRDALLHAEADQKVLRTGQPVSIEEQVQHEAPLGAVDFFTRKCPLHDPAGQIYGVGGISTDITALKNQQRQALLSETVFMCSQEGIVITDPQTRIVRVNPAFTQQTGFSAGVVLGRKTNILRSGRQENAFYAAMWKAINEKGHWSGEIHNRRADGSNYIIWCSINEVRDGAGSLLHCMAVQSDVTQLHDAKEALVRQASYDSLTGLPNRSLFNDRIAQLIEAIGQQQLRVYFQPQCRLSDGALMGAEALVRWQRPGYGLLLPEEFLRTAEKCGLLVSLDHWVMNEALRQLGVWVAAGLWHVPWRLAVNRNVIDLHQPDIVATLQQMLLTHQVDPSAL